MQKTNHTSRLTRSGKIRRALNSGKIPENAPARGWSSGDNVGFLRQKLDCRRRLNMAVLPGWCVAHKSNNLKVYYREGKAGPRLMSLYVPDPFLRTKRSSHTTLWVALPYQGRTPWRLNTSRTLATQYHYETFVSTES